MHIVFIFETLYSGCAEMSISVWDKDGIPQLMKLIEDRMTEEEAITNYNELKDEINSTSHESWDWSFTNFKITKRILNKKD